MALAPTRIAAFEFLIQFRSAGRGSLRNAMRSFQGYKRQIDRAARTSFPNATAAARAYELQLLKNGKAAQTAGVQTYRYHRNLERLTRNSARRAVIARGRAFRQNIASASNSPIARLARNSFGVEAGARTTLGLAKLKTGFQGVTRAASGFLRVLGPIGFAIGAIVSVGGAALGLFFKLARVLGAITGVLVLTAAGLAGLADEYTNLSNRIRVASDGTEAASTTMFRLARIANEARAPLNVVADLFGRVAINAKEFGIEQNDILRVVSTTAKAFRIGGQRREEANAAAIQFAQALGSNRLSGDELRSVREQALELSQIIARGLGVRVGDLKKLGEEGKLTTKAVVDAILSQERITDIRFGKTEATFTDGITNIVSALKVFASATLSAVGLGPKFFNFIDKIAEKFIDISEVSGGLSLALVNLPRFFEALGRTSITGFFNLLKSIGEFFQNLPENIQRTSRNINQFLGLLDQGLSTNEAAQAAFGLSAEQLNNSLFIRGIDVFTELFTKTLPEFANAVKVLTGAMVRTAEVIDGIGKIGGIAQISTPLLNPLWLAKGGYTVATEGRL